MPRFKTAVPLLLLAIAGLSLAGCLPPPPDSADNTDDSPDQQVQELVPAKPGVGKQGQIIGDGGGMLSTPAAALFKTKQRVVFDIQIPQAMKLYWYEHEHHPKTHEEFMKTIIDFNRIPLPELPEGQEYVYDPQAGELMVRRPASQ